MKKLIYFSLVAVTIFLFSCKPNAYKISGEVTNINLNGQTITVSERINRQFVTLGTAVVEDAKFTFTGSCDSARIVYLQGSYPSGTPFQQVFVLENGKINVLIDSVTITFGGTKENDVLQQFMDKQNIFNAEIQDFINSVTENGAIKDEELYAAKMQEFEEKDKAKDLDFVKKNINTAAGFYVFTNAYYYFNIDEKESVFALMDAKTKSNSTIKHIMEITEIEKKTSAGQPFTDIVLTTPEGAELALSSLVGKTDYVLVDFWASWCGPCIRSFPEVKDLYNKYKGTTLEILGVSLDKDKDAWTQAIAQYELPWKHISDLKYWDSKAAQLYGVNSIPATVLIDKNGKIAGRNLNIKKIEEIITQKK